VDFEKTDLVGVAHDNIFLPMNSLAGLNGKKPRILGPMRWIIRFCVALLACQTGLNSPLRASGDAPIAPASAQAYAFRVGADGLILDQKGAPIAVADVPAYLKGLKIPDITVTALWIDGPGAAKNLGPTIQAFGGAFTKVIVKQWDPSEKTGLIDLPAPSKESVKASISDAYPGRSYPPSNPAQSVTLRSGELVPERIPRMVRYRYADGAVVGETAKQISRHFILAAKDAHPIWAGAVAVQAGAWKLFGNDDRLGKSLAARYSARVPTPSGSLDLKQILLRDPDEIRELDSKVCEMVAADGGGQVRALRTDEMRTWWQFISYDITEPIFVLETANQRHRFIIGVNQDGIGMIDELNVLAILLAAGS
jgi:hypothetical protein